MLQPNPAANCFTFVLPSEFFIDSVCEKYDKYFEMMGGTFRSIKDVINESIQSIDMPNYSVFNNIANVNNSFWYHRNF